MTTQCVTS